MKQGIIMKGIGGFYYVKTKDGIMHECKARGRFRKDHLVPLIGDNVMIHINEGDEYDSIDEILPRRNELIRPSVANIDQIIIVFSAKIPEPDFLLLDKILLNAEKSAIDVLICMNKCDLVDSNEESRIKENFEHTGYKIIPTSTRSGQGIEYLRRHLIDTISCFAGQSGVGKSSLLNALSPELQLETGEVSSKIKRGKHTTRHAELIELTNGGMLVDTPGFSLLNLEDMDPEELGYYYPDFIPFLGTCRFSGCLHLEEPECGVKNALFDSISLRRYERYKIIVKELQEKWRKKYD